MQIALVAGGCEADLLSWQGDFDAAAQAARDAIAFVSRSWGEWYLGGIWLAALALAAHADAPHKPGFADSTSTRPLRPAER